MDAASRKEIDATIPFPTIPDYVCGDNLKYGILSPDNGNNLLVINANGSPSMTGIEKDLERMNMRGASMLWPISEKSPASMLLSPGDSSDQLLSPGKFRSNSLLSNNSNNASLPNDNNAPAPSKNNAPAPTYDYNPVPATRNYIVTDDNVKRLQARDLFPDAYDPAGAITIDMRTTIYNWLLDICVLHLIADEAFFHCRILMDMYLDRRLQFDNHRSPLFNAELSNQLIPLRNETLRLVGATCLFISSKLYQVSPLGIDTFIKVSKDVYNMQDFLTMELSILRVVGFDLLYPTVPEFLYYYTSELSQDVKTIANYIAQTYAILGSSTIDSVLVAQLSVYVAIQCTNENYPSCLTFKDASLADNVMRKIAGIKGVNPKRFDIINKIYGSWIACSRSRDRPKPDGKNYIAAGYNLYHTPRPIKESQEVVAETGILHYDVSIVVRPLDGGELVISDYAPFAKRKNDPNLVRFEKFMKILIIDRVATVVIPKLAKFIKTGKPMNHRLYSRSVVPLNMNDLYAFANYFDVIIGNNGKYAATRHDISRIHFNIGSLYAREIPVRVSFRSAPVDLENYFNILMRFLVQDVILNDGVLEGHFILPNR